MSNGHASILTLFAILIVVWMRLSSELIPPAPEAIKDHTHGQSLPTQELETVHTAVRLDEGILACPELCQDYGRS